MEENVFEKEVKAGQETVTLLKIKVFIGFVKFILIIGTVNDSTEGFH